MKRFLKDYETLDSTICIAKNEMALGESNPHHNHDFAEFFFITSGSLIHYYNDNEYVLNHRMAQFIFPENSHHFKIISSSGCTWINISFPLSILSEDINELLLYIFPPTNVKESNIIQLPVSVWDYYMKKIELVSNTTNSKQQAIIFRSLLLDFLITYMNYINMQSQEIPSWLRRTTAKLKEDENYLKGLSWFIQSTKRSQSYINRQMKKYYNMTPTQYINYVKVEASEKLLLESELSISEIALICGFQTIPYFTKTFKKKHGISPSVYRKNHKKINYQYIK